MCFRVNFCGQLYSPIVVASSSLPVSLIRAVFCWLHASVRLGGAVTS